MWCRKHFCLFVISCKSWSMVFLLHLPSRCATTSAVTLRAAQTTRRTRRKKATRLIIPPREKTGLTATMLLLKLEFKTTAADDTEPGAPCSSSLTSSRALFVFWHSPDMQGSHLHSHIHTHTQSTIIRWWTNSGYTDADICFEEPCNDTYDNTRGEIWNDMEMSRSKWFA